MRKLRTLMICVALLAAAMASAQSIYFELLALAVGVIIIWLAMVSYVLKKLDRYEKVHSLEDDWGPQRSGMFLLMVCTPIALIPMSILLVYFLACIGFGALRAIEWAVHSCFPR